MIYAPTPARVLMADPAWLFGDALPGETRGASKQYPCMRTEDICAMEIPPLERDALLLLWRVAAMQQDALDVMKAWGFALKSEIVWKKLTKNGKRHFGMGRYVRAEHEVCLIGARGRFKVESRSVRSVFEAPVQEHSRKPDEIYVIAEALGGGGPFAELFARRRRAGWMQYGNQLESEAA